MQSMTKRETPEQLAEPKNKGGRPSTYTEAKASAIIERVSGPESLQAICLDVGVPVGTFMQWVEDRSEVAERYARAKRSQAEMLAAEIIAISDETDVEVVHEGQTIRLDLSATAIARNRLRVDSRKWVASKLLPKVYGDKLAIGGAADLPPIQSNVTLDPSDAYKAILGGKA